MPELFSTLISKHGTITIFIALVIVVFILWIISHTMSAPGGKVSIFFGLFEYTKKSNPEKFQNIVPENTSENFKAPKKVIDKKIDKVEILNEYLTISIEIIDTTNNPDNPYIEEIRKKYSLREISALESGKKVGNLPNGIYFFVSTTYLDMYSDEILIKKINKIDVQRFKDSIHLFEIQKRKDNEIFLIGYTSQSDAATISLLEGKEKKNIVISPEKIDQFTTIVSIPISRILKSQERRIQLITNQTNYVLDIELQ